MVTISISEEVNGQFENSTHVNMCAVNCRQLFQYSSSFSSSTKDKITRSKCLKHRRIQAALSAAQGQGRNGGECWKRTEESWVSACTGRPNEKTELKRWKRSFWKIGSAEHVINQAHRILPYMIALKKSRVRKLTISFSFTKHLKRSYL